MNNSLFEKLSKNVIDSFDEEEEQEEFQIYNDSEIIQKKNKQKEFILKKKKLIDHIKKLSKEEHIEIFKIFLENKVNYSENNNGIFIPLNQVNEKIIDDIFKYIDYIQAKKMDLIEDDLKVMDKKVLLGSCSKEVVNNFEVNKKIYKEYEFQDNHEFLMNEKINHLLKDMNTQDIDPSKISLKRKKNKYYGNMAKLINCFKEQKENNPQKVSNKPKELSS